MLRTHDYDYLLNLIFGQQLKHCPALVKELPLFVKTGQSVNTLFEKHIKTIFYRIIPGIHRTFAKSLLAGAYQHMSFREMAGTFFQGMREPVDDACRVLNGSFGWGE
ncbi:hypothetical protein [Legionella birminghamensis]|nr:hypothetical protein [Legionella birminghamensis]